MPILLNRFDKRYFPQLCIDQPRLWWPNGYGDPNLYHCKFEVMVDGKVSETKDVSFGIKKYSYDKEGNTFHVYINDVLFEVFRGNGLCVSTPSGSTAYNKSLGGAIIYPGIPLMQMTEVAGIHHNAYRSLGSSLILDESQTIKLEGNQFKHALIGIDHIHLQMDDVESIEVTIGKRYVNFIEYKEMSFIKRVRRAFINS